MWEGVEISPLDLHRFEMSLVFSPQDRRVGRGTFAKMYSLYLSRDSKILLSAKVSS